jgi:hypothetical protein
MAPQAGLPLADHDPNPVYLRQDEITLLLSPEDFDWSPDMPFEELQDKLPAFDEDGARDHLRKLDIFLDGEGEDHPPSVVRTPGTGKIRPLIPVLRDGKVFVVQTINLQGWQTTLNSVDHQDPDRLRKTINFVNILNDDSNIDMPIGNYRLKAAAPSWLVMPFQDFCWGCSPGGRPVPIPNGSPLDHLKKSRRFRPDPDAPVVGPDPIGLDVVSALIALGQHDGEEPDVKFASGGEIAVAVLDTWPIDVGGETKEERAFANIAKRHAAINGGGVVKNARLAALANHQIVHPSNVEDLFSEFSSVGDLRCGHYLCNGHFEPPYSVSDHGVFIADLIKDIAPDAEIWPYRVVNDWGAGDIYTVAAAIHHAIVRARKENKRLVINLSGGIGPQFDEIIAMMPGTAATKEAANRATAAKAEGGPRDVDTARQNLLDANLLREVPADAKAQDARGYGAAVQPRPGESGGVLEAEPAQAAVAPRFEFTNMLAVADYLFAPLALQHNALVVAAAGNDSFRYGICGDGKNIVRDPRLPAAVQGVIGVAAFRSDGDLADYSNDNDFTPMVDGISAYGGEADNATTASSEGLVGLYISDRFPSSQRDMFGEPTGNPGNPNDDGWALWAGTSFAAPIVSGYAACLWSETRIAGGAAMAAEDLLNAIVNKPATMTARGKLPFTQQ